MPKSKEGSAKDRREDASLAKMYGMTQKEWEGSSRDKKHDAPSRKANKPSRRK